MGLCICAEEQRFVPGTRDALSDRLRGRIEAERNQLLTCRRLSGRRPLALVDAEMPVVTVAPNDELLEKLKGNMEEVRARKGELFVFSDQGCNIQPSEGMHVIQLPENYAVLSPILHVIPLQLLAYHTAIAKGTDVDKPRNLAKSVTTE